MKRYIPLFLLSLLVVCASCDPIEDAIKKWSSKTRIEQGERTVDDTIDFINNFEYEDADTYFYIYSFTFE